MKIGATKELYPNEKRVAMTPQSATALQKLGYECLLLSGAGDAARFSDAQYQAAGVTIVQTADELWSQADIVTKLRAPTDDEIKYCRRGQIVVSFILPAQSEALLATLAQQGVTTLAMDMVPRISRAQKMDALSSMANISGYRAVIEAGNHFERFLTGGQMTAAGKVPPAKLLVIGAGVAGLAAIGVAESMGAIVRAFDVRPEVAEQIESMGASFLLLDFEEDASDDGGYAAPSSPAFREKQLACFRQQAKEVDVVITTASIPGREAPKLWLKDMVAMMKPGSVVVDLAAERGGNCDLTVVDEVVESENGVRIIGYTDFPSRMAHQSSALYATNIRHLIDDLTPEKNGVAVINMTDDVIRAVTVTHDEAITFPPPPPIIAAIAPATKTTTPKMVKVDEASLMRQASLRQIKLLIAGGVLMALIGAYAPATFMQHFIVFVLACFIGFQVIWKVSHALHTPLMAVTNAISGIIIVGALLQMGSDSNLVMVLASLSVFIATINIVGGFVVTRRMLAMFQKSQK